MASIPLTATEGGGRKYAMPGVEEERALDTGVLLQMPRTILMELELHRLLGLACEKASDVCGKKKTCCRSFGYHCTSTTVMDVWSVEVV